MVVIRPRSMPIASCSTLATGARQLVVHDALEMTWWLSGSYASSKLTPRATVTSGSVAGAEMITLWAPASRCLAASSRLVKKPVDSITTSTPRSLHGSAAGSRSASTRTSRPSTCSASPATSTVPGKGPKTESYLSRCASVRASVMSLTATISMSASDSCAARKTLRPMRPKPLIPTRTGMPVPFVVSAWSAAPSLPGAAQRQPVDVAVLDLHHELVAVAEVRGQVLGDHHRAVAPSGAADRHHEVRLALGDVLRQQVVEQRDHVLVELLEAPVAADVVDDALVEA